MSPNNQLSRTAVPTLLCILHNIEVSTPFELEPFALVPSKDSRMQSILARSPAARHLFEGFRDQFHSVRRPTGLIHFGTSSHVDTALTVAFRNVFAISCLIKA